MAIALHKDKESGYFIAADEKIFNQVGIVSKVLVLQTFGNYKNSAWFNIRKTRVSNKDISEFVFDGEGYKDYKQHINQKIIKSKNLYNGPKVDFEYINIIKELLLVKIKQLRLILPSKDIINPYQNGVRALLLPKDNDMVFGEVDYIVFKEQVLTSIKDEHYCSENLNVINKTRRSNGLIFSCKVGKSKGVKFINNVRTYTLELIHQLYCAFGDYLTNNKECNDEINGQILYVDSGLRENQLNAVTHTVNNLKFETFNLKWNNNKFDLYNGNDEVVFSLNYTYKQWKIDCSVISSDIKKLLTVEV